MKEYRRKTQRTTGKGQSNLSKRTKIEAGSETWTYEIGSLGVRIFPPNTEKSDLIAFSVLAEMPGAGPRDITPAMIVDYISEKKGK
jgi:hypothetical protein